MSVHLTEEEQIEVFKRWWKENGKIIAVAAAVVILAYFGWTAWKEKQALKAETAALTYDSLIKLVVVEPGKTLSDVDRATAKHLATELKEKNSKTLYASNAAFFLTKLAVDSGDLDAAAKELQSLIASKPDVATTQMARVRLARVFIAKGAYAEASAQVAEEPSKSFSSEYAEVRGDILRAQGNNAAALTAYEKAVADTNPEEQQRLLVLNMKVDDLKMPAAVEEKKALVPEEKAPVEEQKVSVEEEKTE